MKNIAAVMCVVLLVTFSTTVIAEETDDEEMGEEVTVEETVSDSDYVPKKKSVAIATMLSVIPSFGAGLYYTGEYYMGISSTIGMATGLGLFLDAQFRTHNDSAKVTGITLMGTSWLFGLIYAPLSAHQYNKSLEEEYGFAPYVGFSHKEFYAGVGFPF